MPKSFEPVIRSSSRILILGSMPGEESLRKREYYGNPRNQFWRILYSLFGREKDEVYEKRLEFALEHKIALWDVIESCQREGSLDSNIKEPSPHDFAWLYETYPQIQGVVFNGGKAYEVYRRQVGLMLKEGLGYLALPSTSPANTLRYEDKLEKWRSIIEYLGED